MGKKKSITIIAILTAVIVAGVFYMDYRGGGDRLYTTKNGYISAYTRKNLDRAIKYDSIDYAAFLQMEQSGLTVKISDGHQVFIEKRIWDKILIRKEGSETPFWTVRGAVE